MMRFTHFIVLPDDGADLLAGDVTECLGCNRSLFRDHLFISDGEEETVGEMPTAAAQLARGRVQLPDNALRVDEGDTFCDACRPNELNAHGQS